MSKDAPVPVHSPAVRGGRPSSWGVLVAGFFLCLALSGVTAALGRDLLEQRPLDLRNHAAYLAAHFEHLLVREGIGPDKIRRGEPTYQHFDRGGGWYFYPFEVALAAEQKPRELAGVLREELGPYGVQVTLVHSQAGPVVRLALNNQDFAQVILQPEAPQPRVDLRAESNRAVNLCIEALERAGAVMRIAAGPEEHEDGQRQWTHTRLRASFRELPDANLLRQLLEETLAHRDARLIVGAGPQEELRVRLYLGGRDFLEIAVERTPVLPPHARVRVPETGTAIAPPAMPDFAPPPAPPAPTEEPHAPGPEYAEGPLITIEELKPPPEAPFMAKDPRQPDMPRLALIIDDGGYGGPHTDRLLELDNRLTLAILPNTPFGTEIAQRAYERGFEIMLHMPMETFGAALRFPGEIKVSMDEEEIRQLTLDALSQIPGVVGVNNHTGSKYTQYADKMRKFMKVVQEQDLYFVDSITVERSKGYAVARDMNLRAGKRDLFIDNSSNPEQIRRYLRLVIERAKSQGSAIGIGHFRPNTVRVLAEELPRLEEYGVVLVHASELVY